MKKILLILFLFFWVPVFWVSWYTDAEAYDHSINLTDRVSDVAVYSMGAFNYSAFSAEFGRSFGSVSLVGSTGVLSKSGYFYRPPDADYNGILPVLNTDSGGGYSWAFSSLRTRISFTDPVSAFSVDMGDKGADADTIYLALYTAGGELISEISREIGEEISSFHTLDHDSDSFDIAYVDFWGIDSNEENTVYFNTVSFTSLSPVPLPGSLLLLGSGLVTCLFSRRKQGKL